MSIFKKGKLPPETKPDASPADFIAEASGRTLQEAMDNLIAQLPPELRDDVTAAVNRATETTDPVGGFDVQAALDQGFFKVLKDEGFFDAQRAAPVTACPVSAVLREVHTEAHRAMEKHAPMHSAHEGISVLREELDELWDEVKADRGYQDSARKEAIQIAAMAVRYVLNVCDRNR